MTTSAPLPLISENIPLALRQGKRFAAWRSEPRKDQPKPAKMPYSPPAPKGASSTAPGDWVDFERAVKYSNVAGLDGIMRAFDHADNLVGIDLDNCRDPETGELTERAAEFVKRCDTYTEVSPSGTGVKMWMYGTMPPFGHKKGDVEIYGSMAGQTGPCGRFFTMTGRQLPGTPSTVGYRPDAVLAIHREVFGDAPDLTITPDDPDRPIPALQIGDEDVLRLAADSPHNGERFRRLWSGDTSAYAVDGNDGESEADCALCELLAYYGGPDPERIERLWLRSGLVREKTERADYRKRTISTALRGKTRFYGDSVRPVAGADADTGTGDGHLDCPEANRLRGLLLDRDDLVEHQQGLIRDERAKRQALTETIRRITDVLAIPTERLSPSSKVLTIVTVLEAHSRDGRGVETLPGSALVQRSGMSKNTVNSFMQDLAARDGSPIDRRITREWVEREDGSKMWETVSLVSPRAESVNASLAAVLTMGGPSDKAAEKAKAKRDREIKRQTRGIPFGRCSHCDNNHVAVTGICPEHHEIVGETVVRREDFQILNPNRRDSAEAAAGTVDVRPLVPNRRDSGFPDPAMALPAAEPLNHTGRDSGSTPVSLFPDAVVSEDVKRQDQDYTGPCLACQATTVWRRVAGVTRCGSCTVVIHIEPWADPPPPESTDGRLPGFDPPPAPAAERWYAR